MTRFLAGLAAGAASGALAYAADRHDRWWLLVAAVTTVLVWAGAYQP